MSTIADSRVELKRLQLALVAVSEDLDAMQGCPHPSLRFSAENLDASRSQSLNALADPIAGAMEASTARPIEIAPKEGEFVVLGNDADGKPDIARWVQEEGGWIRENGEPIGIVWYPRQAASDPQQGLRLSSHRVVEPGWTATAPVADLGIRTPALDRRSSRARRRVVGSSIAAILVVAVTTCIGLYLRGVPETKEVLLNADEVTAQPWGTEEAATAELQRSLRQERDKSTALTSQLAMARRDLEAKVELSGKPGDEVRQRQAMEAAATAELQQLLQQLLRQERDNTAALANELATVRRDIEAKVALSSKARDEAQARQAAEEAATAELQRSLRQERDKAAALAVELATARRDLEAHVEISSKDDDEATQRRQVAEQAASAELQRSLQQERDKSAALVSELAMARHAIEAKVAPSSSAGDEAEQLGGGARAVVSEPRQEPNGAVAPASEVGIAPRSIGIPPPERVSGDSQLDQMKRAVDVTAALPARTEKQSNPEAVRLIARARTLLAQGNIGAARLLLERAAETGSAEANFALAETYDPVILSSLGASGTRGEAVKARELYAKAQRGGVQEAQDRIDALH